ncbi:MAG: hypothetical protein KDD47_13890 [Acidobacteria bacterium]|nr:hypothetical protein [Acidobacteriota bacterium]
MRRALTHRLREGVFASLLVLFLSLALAPAATAHIVIQGDAGYVAKVEECLEKIAQSGGKAGANLTQLTNSNNVHTIKQNSGTSSCSPSNGTNATNGTGTGSTTKWDPDLVTPVGGVQRDPCASLAHELDHAKHNDSGDNDFTSTGHNGIPTAEIEACSTENEYRKANGLPERTTYGGKRLP